MRRRAIWRHSARRGGGPAAGDQIHRDSQPSAPADFAGRSLRAGWRWRRWIEAKITVALLAGPWFIRNYLATGNPLYPIAISIGRFHVFGGLFTPARSRDLAGVADVWNVLTGPLAIPRDLLIAMAIAWIAIVVFRFRQLAANSLLRIAVLGPPIGLAIFAWKAPFAEARFVFPAMVLAMATAAAAVAMVRPKWIGWLILLAGGGDAVWTQFAESSRYLAMDFAAVAALATLAVVAAVWLTRNWNLRSRIGLLGGTPSLLLFVWGFIFWSQYIITCQSAIFQTPEVWRELYPTEQPLWVFVDQNLPQNAVVAYTNTFLIYPLQGQELRRRVGYAPTRPGVKSQADLPWLGDQLPGEAVVAAAARATVADADRATWLRNLRAMSAEYLVVGRGGELLLPPEAKFAADDPRRFHMLFDGPGGTVYAIDWSSDNG